MKLKLKHLLWVPVGIVAVPVAAFIAFALWFMIAWSISWNRLYNEMAAYAKENAVEIVREVALLQERRRGEDISYINPDNDIFSVNDDDEYLPRIIELNPHWMYWDDDGFLVLKVWGADRTYMGLLVASDEADGRNPDIVSNSGYTYKKIRKIAPGIWTWK